MSFPGKVEKKTAEREKKSLTLVNEKHSQFFRLFISPSCLPKMHLYI